MGRHKVVCFVLYKFEVAMKKKLVYYLIYSRSASSCPYQKGSGRHVPCESTKPTLRNLFQLLLDESNNTFDEQHDLEKMLKTIICSFSLFITTNYYDGLCQKNVGNIIVHRMSSNSCG